ncbi:hypothetical protein LEP1GSC074_1314 [Leptospira noguchii str. Hook]|nr:hypothetical protein LEP1GSC074_1314 [Leptospira noguchii str. Hook]
MHVVTELTEFLKVSIHSSLKEEIKLLQIIIYETKALFQSTLL